MPVASERPCHARNNDLVLHGFKVRTPESHSKAPPVVLRKVHLRDPFCSASVADRPGIDLLRKRLVCFSYEPVLKHYQPDKQCLSLHAPVVMTNGSPPRNHALRCGSPEPRS